jgi:hypothetical protein
MTININLVKKYIKPDIINRQPELVTTIIKHDFLLENRIAILNKITGITNYKNKYESIKSTFPVEFGELDETLEKFDLNDEYFIVTYNFLINAPAYDFNEYIFKMTHIKNIIFCLIDSYYTIINNLFDLYNIDICYFNVEPENIVFYKNSTPILINFQHSFKINHIDYENFNKIITDKTNFIYYPIEIHLLFYIKSNNLDYISFDDIEQLSSRYVDKLSVLSFFSQSYRKKYKELCVQILEKYLNVEKGNIFKEVINHAYTWDNFCLSVLFIHLFGSLINKYSLKGTFLNEFVLVLSQNIHPNPIKREKMNYNIEQYELLFGKHTDWGFINKLPNLNINISDYFDVL